MRIAIGSDEKTPLTDFVIEEVKKRGHKVELFGPLKGKPLSWVEVGEQVALSTSKGNCHEGILYSGKTSFLYLLFCPGVLTTLSFSTNFSIEPITHQEFTSLPACYSI